jgi:hypothetical protein
MIQLRRVDALKGYLSWTANATVAKAFLVLARCVGQKPDIKPAKLVRMDLSDLHLVTWIAVSNSANNALAWNLRQPICVVASKSLQR